jgi:phosphonate metabolism protein PhnN/1,5-bisphosphokinase (PRPP-forming)
MTNPPGLWVLVCGASGAGKDSVITWAAQHLELRDDIVFARRMVTRAPHPGSDHDAVTQSHFGALTASQALVWYWEAHGFQYGIDAHYADDVAAGRTVVVNGSRAHAAAQASSEHVRVVQIVADASLLASRMAQRGRDAPEDVARRLARNAALPHFMSDCTILNHGELAHAGRQLADYLVKCASSPRGMVA